MIIGYLIAISTQKENMKTTQTEATPTYIANNNLSLVAKYFVDKWQTNLAQRIAMQAAGLITTLITLHF